MPLRSKLGRPHPGRTGLRMPMGAPSRSHPGKWTSGSQDLRCISATSWCLQGDAGECSSNVLASTTRALAILTRSCLIDSSDGGRLRGSVPKASGRFRRPGSRERAAKMAPQTGRMASQSSGHDSCNELGSSMPARAALSSICFNSLASRRVAPDSCGA